MDGVVRIDSEEEMDALYHLDAIADTVGGATIQRLPMTIRSSGGVLGSVLGHPEGEPDASRLFELADAARDEFSIPIAQTMRLEEIQEAHRLRERGGLRGKIILIS
jgi:Zn-dependent alcohol dehydrogenase